eukprot:5564606-Prymnesium_polylepis.1
MPAASSCSRVQSSERCVPANAATARAACNIVGSAKGSYEYNRRERLGLRARCEYVTGNGGHVGQRRQH